MKLNAIKRLVLVSLVTLSVSGGTRAPIVAGPAAIHLVLESPLTAN